MNKKRIKKLFAPFYYRCFRIPMAKWQQYQVVQSIRRRGYANVVFFAANLSMWRYQGIYELLKNDSRFRPYIVICPFSRYSKEDEKRNVEELKEFFDARNTEYIDSSNWTKEEFDIRKTIKPDILFYAQQYDGLYKNRCDCHYYYDRLLCLYPYGMPSFSNDLTLNQKYHNLAWRLFYENDFTLKEASRYAYNKGKNVVIVGNSNADIFMSQKHSNVWKSQEREKKRVIWAPHFSIKGDIFLHRGAFLWLYDVMLDLAAVYSDKIQFAFKPHPRLRTALYEHPEWGKERTDAYYEKWASLSNCQLEMGAFADLFMTSDAMIHDSASFTIDYHFTQNPVMFTTDDLQSVTDQLNECGLQAMKAHYIGKCKDDIKHFVEGVVLNGKDSMKAQRKTFFNDYLLPPNGKTVAENTYNEIVKALGF